MTARVLAVGVLAPLATLAVVVAGLRVSVPGGLPAVAAAGLRGHPGLGRSRGRVRQPAARRAAGPGRGRWPSAPWPGRSPSPRPGWPAQPGPHALARAVATVAAPLVIAASVAFVLAAPDGRLGSRARRGAAGLAACWPPWAPGWCWPWPGARSRPWRPP